MIKIFRNCTIILLLIVITGCIDAGDQKISILDDGSVLYEFSIIFRKASSQETNKFKNEAQAYADCYHTLASKFRDMSNVQYVDDYLSFFTKNGEVFAQYKIEIKINDLNYFNSTIDRLSRTTITQQQVDMIFLEKGLAVDDYKKNYKLFGTTLFIIPNALRIKNKYDSKYYFESTNVQTIFEKFSLTFVSSDILSSNGSTSYGQTRWEFNPSDDNAPTCRADFDIGTLMFYKSKANRFIDDIKKKFD
jgi:hypothetical protein